MVLLAFEGLNVGKASMPRGDVWLSPGSDTKAGIGIHPLSLPIRMISNVAFRAFPWAWKLAIAPRTAPGGRSQ